MLKFKLAPLIGGVIALVLASAAPALAQEGFDPGERADRPSSNSDRPDGTRTTREDRRRERQPRQPAPPTPEELRAGAQVIVDAAGVACQVTEANKLGQLPEGGDVYEAACATGPGYMLLGTTPPTASDCVGLAGAATLAREADPAAETGLQCTLPANQNHLAVIADYARQAGVPCTIDEGLSVGQGRYDVGCPNGVGYWIDQTDAGWERTSCFELSFQANRVCRYTTREELNGVWTTALAGTPGADCAVTQARRMGKDAQDRFVYELKCAAADTGYIIRMNSQLRADEALNCATPEAQAIAGGCTLTVVAAPAEE